MIADRLSHDELRQLPATVTPKESFRILGFAITKGYTLIQRGEFPVPVHKVGSRLQVPTAPILRYLGVESDDSDHRPLTQGSSSNGEPRNSCVVKTKRGKVIRPNKYYTFRGERWNGADIIAIAQLLGVA